LPLFAFANTAIIFPGELAVVLASPIHYGILFGLVLGKPLGIFGMSWLMVKMRFASLPQGIGWKHIGGMGMIAGIGFTMSIFISMLAFKDPESQTTAKLAVLIASLVAGISGYIYLRFLDKKQQSSAGD
jgi:NhaA family Na+:H+ antiporter